MLHCSAHWSCEGPTDDLAVGSLVMDRKFGKKKRRTKRRWRLDLGDLSGRFKQFLLLRFERALERPFGCLCTRVFFSNFQSKKNLKTLTHGPETLSVRCAPKTPFKALLAYPLTRVVVTDANRRGREAPANFFTPKKMKRPTISHEICVFGIWILFVDVFC